MERKIGEIFTYNGKTYQVLKATDGCKGCTFFRIQLGTCINRIESCFAEDRGDKTSIIFKEINNMKIKNNQLTIDIPKGMEIDTKNSDFTKGIIKFKPKYIIYDDIEKTLHLKETCIGITLDSGNIDKLYAITQLMNIAKYYNKDWKPNWNNDIEFKYHIVFDYFGNMYKTSSKSQTCNSIIYFAHREDAQSVIDNPNFKEILDVIYKY